MKKINLKYIVSLFAISLFMFLAIGTGDETESSDSESKSKVDTCRCLTEPGNSSYMKDNKKACRDAISKAIGVPNWEKVNMSQNPSVDAKFDKLASDCGL